jgi:anti-sigma B factor antagonist
VLRNTFFHEVLEGVSVVKAKGDLDYSLTKEFLSFCQSFSGDMVIDLSELEYLDSSGLGALLSINKELFNRGNLLVVVPSETSSAIFNLTRVDGIFRVANSISEALSIIDPHAPA